jgi:hypothetical protein
MMLKKFAAVLLAGSIVAIATVAHSMGGGSGSGGGGGAGAAGAAGGAGGAGMPPIWRAMLATASRPALPDLRGGVTRPPAPRR